MIQEAPEAQLSAEPARAVRGRPTPCGLRQSRGAQQCELQQAEWTEAAGSSALKAPVAAFIPPSPCKRGVSKRGGS